MTTPEPYIYQYTYTTKKAVKQYYQFMLRFGLRGKKKIMGKHRKTIAEAVADRETFMKDLKNVH